MNFGEEAEDYIVALYMEMGFHLSAAFLVELQPRRCRHQPKNGQAKLDLGMGLC